ncbi:hypothetical protein Pcinc_027792 [Petrolisthes cinctipes]|uniref:Ionotropic glutamate receptor L-glutamate and glycine-binding domain-containing protein n=1 Tax=Petrolisthes cinctipes TaxID=88211 RepID=A0AAE1K852_PETCI|nr:hypothetical protein Pcinc_027792 [Petrolisthes cinctipes]
MHRRFVKDGSGVGGGVQMGTMMVQNSSWPGRLSLLVVVVVMVAVVGIAWGGVDEPSHHYHYHHHLLTDVMDEVTESYMRGCHVVLVTDSHTSPLFHWMLRRVWGSDVGVMVVHIGQEDLDRKELLQGVWLDSATLRCRTLLLLLHSTHIHYVTRFLETGGLWRWPDARIVVLGDKDAAHTLLLHPALRNAGHTLYLATHTHHLQPSPPPPTFTFKLRRSGLENQGERMVKVLWRSVDGDEGRPSIHAQSSTQPLPSPLSSGGEGDLRGRVMRVVTLEYIPFILYKEEMCLGGTVTLQDSIDYRILDPLAASLNFTYEVIEPKDCMWGQDDEHGNWSGIVGSLQHQEADFSLNLTPTFTRLAAIDFSVIYSSDSMVIISPKPKPLPRHLSLLRPFLGDVWVGIGAMTVVLCVVLWVQQKTWPWVSGGGGGGGGLENSGSIFTSIWGILLDNSLSTIPSATSAKVVVGTWILAALVVTSAYRSSLVAHLTVQERYPPINSFEDLLNAPDWAWGSTNNIAGTSLIYFTRATNPVIQQIYKRLRESMELVLEGQFSCISWLSFINTDLAAVYGDPASSPFHFSSTTYPIGAGNAWGFRKGAPFLGVIRRMKQRMIEAGLVKHWEEMFVSAYVNNDQSNLTLQHNSYPSQDDGSVGQEVLGLEHLEGAFYLLLFGHALATLVLIVETFIVPFLYKRSSTVYTPRLTLTPLSTSLEPTPAVPISLTPTSTVPTSLTETHTLSTSFHR